MQPLRLKTLSAIFVAVRDLTLIVSVKTRQRCKALGFEGMQFKWNRDRQHWYGPLSCKNLEALDRWPEAELSPCRCRRANVNHSTAHMFIVNPLKGKAMATLCSTHPSTEERIARLRSMQ